MRGARDWYRHKTRRPTEVSRRVCLTSGNRSAFDSLPRRARRMLGIFPLEPGLPPQSAVVVLHGRLDIFEGTVAVTIGRIKAEAIGRSIIIECCARAVIRLLLILVAPVVLFGGGVDAFRYCLSA